MDTLNNAIESLMTSSSKEEWPSVNMNVADATVTVISEKVRRVADTVGLSGIQCSFAYDKLLCNSGTCQGLASRGLCLLVIKITYMKKKENCPLCLDLCTPLRGFCSGAPHSSFAQEIGIIC